MNESFDHAHPIMSIYYTFLRFPWNSETLAASEFLGNLGNNASLVLHEYRIAIYVADSRVK